MFVGREMSQSIPYLLRRASEELEVRPAGGFFERLAAPYVALFGVPEIGAQVRVTRAVRALPSGARTVLDVGCGPGLLLGALARELPHAQCTGIEIDPEATKVAEQLHPHCRIVTGDFLTEAATFSDFDAVCTVDVLEHIAQSELLPFTRALFGALRPGGALVIHVPASGQRRHFKRFLDWEHHDHEREGFMESELRELLFEAGFEGISIEGTFGYWGSLAWELNMLLAGSPVQALVYPPSLVIGSIDNFVRSKRYNGWLVRANRPQ